MTPITDPTLISQLEGSGGQSLGTPVTDPNLVAQLEGGAAPGENPSFLPRVGADVLAGLAKMGNGIINTPGRLVNAIDPGSNFPLYKPNYNYGQALGVNAPNVGDKLVQGTAQYAPYAIGGEAALAGKVAPALMTRLGIQSGAGATFGATQSPNPAQGATIGAAFGVGGELAPAALGSAKNLIGNSLSAIKPQAYAENLLNTLGNGNSLESNAQSLAQNIRNAYQQQVANGQNIYKNLFNSLGNNPIYNRVAPIFGSSQKGNYENLPASITNNFDGDLKDLHNNFIANPTLNNAHQLQSQLGASIGSMNYQNAKGLLDQSDKNTLQSYQRARQSLLGDINSYLGNQGIDAVSAYKSATNNWSQNIAPYLADSNLAQIAKGEITNPTYSQINNIFKSPEPEIQKVVTDAGPQANSQILFNELGKTQSKLTPEKLSNAYNSLENKGLASYITPDISSQFDSLAAKTGARNATQAAAAGILGAHFFGPLGAALAAGGPKALSWIGQRSPSLNLSLGNTLSQALKTGYRPALNATAATVINQQGGQ